MCGIAGILNLGHPPAVVDQSELRRISNHMAARGPDGEGLWVDPSGVCGLAHRRLAIIDTSDAGLQPMTDPESGLVIVFNGEIYNFRELRIELALAGDQFRTATDTEVILKLYARHGSAAWSRLRGMFALAIWDPARRTLTLVRDGFGIKPLYIAHNGQTIRFASQVKALQAGGVAGRSRDLAGEAGFLLWGHVPEPFTLWQDIRALPPGTALEVGADGSRLETRFFDLAHELANPPPLPVRPRSADDALALLRDSLKDSVRHHLIADVPVGLFLSAGIDSSVLTALATVDFPHQIETMCLGFPEFTESSADETGLARAVAALYGTAHREVSVTPAMFGAARDLLLAAMDQPSIDGINVFLVSAAARAQGWKVALSGLGADELFGGYASFNEVPRMVRLLRSVPGRRILGQASGEIIRMLDSKGISPKLAGLLEFGGSWSGAYLLKRGLFLPAELKRRFTRDELGQALGQLETEPQLARTVEGIDSERARMSALEMRWYMRNQLLRDADWASMAHGLEIRVPFVDTELLRLVAGLATAGFPMGKQELGRVPEPPLPAPVLSRPKTGFQVPLWKWAGLAAPQQPGRVSRQWAETILAQFTGFAPKPAGSAAGAEPLIVA